MSYPLWSRSVDTNCSVKSALETCSWLEDGSSEWLGWDFWLLRACWSSLCSCEGSLREMRCPWPELTRICDEAGLSILMLGHMRWSVEPSAKNFRLGWIHLWVHLLTVVVFFFFIIIIFISEFYSDTLLQAGKCSSEAKVGAGGAFSTLKVAASFLPFHSCSSTAALYPALGLAPKKG